MLDTPTARMNSTVPKGALPRHDVASGDHARTHVPPTTATDPKKPGGIARRSSRRQFALLGRAARWDLTWLDPKLAVTA